MSEAARSYELRFEHRPEWLEAYISAPKDSVEVSLAYIREIAEECRRSNCQRVLVVEDIPTNLSTLEMHEVCARAADLGGRGLIVAYVDLCFHETEANQFRETVAVNRGINIRFFRTVAEAQAWLRSEEN